jgi:hypothetical protein
VCWAFIGKDCEFRDFYSENRKEKEKEKEEAALKNFIKRLVFNIIKDVERLIYYVLKAKEGRKD